jgi:hypothetical protein
MLDFEIASGFDTRDFLARWERARRSALRKTGCDAKVDPELPEESMIAAGVTGADSESRADALLRAVFDNSRLLALGLSRQLGLTFEIRDFQALIAASGIPCFAGAWEESGEARVLRRPACADRSGAGVLACDYWREALDGIVTGLGEKERLARHGCGRRGDPACVDVLFDEEACVGPVVSEAWGAVPEHLAIDLHEAVEYFRARTGQAVGIKGINEGVLHYEILAASGAPCAGGPVKLRFEDVLAERMPDVGHKDVTPRAVLGENLG